MRAIAGDCEGMLGVRIGNLGEGGEGGLVSMSIKLLDSGIRGGDDTMTLA